MQNENKKFETSTEKRIYERKMKKKKKKLKLLPSLIIIAIIFALTFFFGTSSRNAATTKLVSKGIGSRTNVLIVGTDGGESRADVMMIASISPGEVNLISIPRDTRIEAGQGNYVKLNSALAIGGDDYLIEKISEVSGIEINDYVKVNFKAVESVVNIFGGVDFEVPQDMDYEDPEQDLYIHLKQGYQHLNGDQSLQLLRFRKYAMADIQRNSVQRDFIKAFVGQNLKPSSVLRVPALAVIYKTRVVSSMNLIKVIRLCADVAVTGDVNTFEVPYYISPSGTYVLIDDKNMAEIVNEYF